MKFQFLTVLPLLIISLERVDLNFCLIDINGIPQVPLFQKGVDYQFEYHKLFHDNEMKLQQYDKLLQDRVKDLKLF